MVTMADVGRVAGVNASTVSHVLNGTRTVSDGTRQRVLQAITSTGYRHNVLARSLATSNTMVMGVAISSVTNPYFGDLLRSVESSARAAGYMLMVADTGDDAAVERRVVEQLVDRRVDGILLAPAPGAAGGSLPFLQNAGVPTVLIDRFAEADLDQIAPDNVGPTAQLTGHLAELGHHRIAMVAGLRGLHSTHERVEDYRQVVSQRGLHDDPAFVLDGASDTATAYTAVLRLFASRSRPSAVVVGNNAMTIGAMRALRTLKLVVPQEVALVCYDDFEWADLFEPSLTAMDQNVALMGRKAVELMSERMAHPDAPRRRERVAPTYRHRSSCGCGARDEPLPPPPTDTPARTKRSSAHG